MNINFSINPMLITFLMVFISCAQAPNPSRDDLKDGSHLNNDTTNKEKIPDDTNPNPNTPPHGYTDFTQCLADCQTACSKKFSSDKTQLDECYLDCSLPYDLGGCAPAENKPEGSLGDKAVDWPPDYEKIKIKLHHCTHNSDALLLHNNGTLNFETQRGILVSKLSEITDFSMATAGNAGQGNSKENRNSFTYETHARAQIEINGTQHTWNYPGALAFPLYLYLPEIDSTKPVYFYKIGHNMYGRKKQEDAAKEVIWEHWNNYWGSGLPHGVVFYNLKSSTWTEEKNWWPDKKHYVNCNFSTEFTVGYAKKQS